MPRLYARLSDYERDSLLLAIAAMLTEYLGVGDLSSPTAKLSRQYLELLAAEVKAREENR